VHLGQPTLASLSRRRFLGATALALGTAAGGSLLVSCGSDEDEAGDTSELGLEPVDEGTRVLRPMFNVSSFAVAGLEQRLVFAIGDASGLPLADAAPDSLVFDLLVDRARAVDTTAVEQVPADLQPVGEPIDVARRLDGVPAAYYPLRFTFPEPGFYTVRTTPPGGGEIEATLIVSGPGGNDLVQPGSPMPRIETPTTAAPLGVDPLCTRQPSCALHDLSLDAALADGRPVAFLVSTPAFCQIGVCGPVLDLVIEQQAAYPDVQFIHCEVYRNEEGPQTGDLVQAVGDLGMEYEPGLFLVRDSVLVERLDNVFDRTELIEALDALGA
jgi:hypothetical protein